MEKLHMAGKYLILWEKYDTIKIEVNFMMIILIIAGNPCQVADVAFNNKCFEIIEAENNMPFRKNQFKSMIISIGLESAEKQLG